MVRMCPAPDAVPVNVIRAMLNPNQADQDAIISDQHALIVQCQQGDRQAFNRLVMRYQHLVYNFLYRLNPGSEHVDDLAQDVFIKVFRSLRTLKDPDQFIGWLHKIAVRVYLDDRRRYARVRQRLVTDEGVLEMQADPRSDQARTLAQQELQQALEEAMARLPEEFRLAIVLREIQDLSYEEIAQALRCSIGTVRSRIFRGRQLLRAMLAEHISP
jgi:RNA polymerase sigma-70 factor, ECF subfamily